MMTRVVRAFRPPRNSPQCTKAHRGEDGSFEGLKEFSRMTGQRGFEHHVIEGVWSRWTPEQRKEMVDYSSTHGVGVWFWKHRKELRTAREQEEFFSML